MKIFKFKSTKYDESIIIEIGNLCGSIKREYKSPLDDTKACLEMWFEFNLEPEKIKIFKEKALLVAQLICCSKEDIQKIKEL